MLCRAQHIRDVGARPSPERLAGNVFLVVGQVLVISLLALLALTWIKVEDVEVYRLLPRVGGNDLSDLVDSCEAGEVVVHLQ